MKPMSCLVLACLALGGAGDSESSQEPLSLVVATVDNAHMLELAALSQEFEKRHPDIKLRWVKLREGELRKSIHSDVQTQMNRFDVLTVGMYEVPILAEEGRLLPLTLPADYEVGDLIDNIREGLTHKGQLYAAPFYGESSMTYYRRDLFAKAGLSMPAQPTWSEIAAFAAKLHDPRSQVHGICLRGRPGWGENMTLIATIANAFGGQWFDMQWQPRLNSPAWRQAVSLYTDLLRRYGPADATVRGYNDNLKLFNAGRCAIWVDATVAAAFVVNPALNPQGADVGFAPAPAQLTSTGSRWLWSWALAVPRGISIGRAKAAQTFVAWATSREYVRLVAARKGWDLVPAGNRKSTYAIPEFKRVAPWAVQELNAIVGADPHDATLPPSPYVGIQYAAIRQFAAIGDGFGRAIADAVEGRIAVEAALARGQVIAERQLALEQLPPVQRRSAASPRPPGRQTP